MTLTTKQKIGRYPIVLVANIMYFLCRIFDYSIRCDIGIVDEDNLKKQLRQRLNDLEEKLAQSMPRA